ncbi:MAG: hypothetical protein OEZ39_17120 [Gammaproteobacteria bacterium]|nr:hypothetical protein [Gammaproteobacteria bacterium]MDH5653584.1 hypothetical protein [Gammaproteobacteria bacterium]
MKYRLYVFVCLLTMPTLSNAIEIIFDFGIHFGGDTLSYPNGTTTSIGAGDSFMGSVGLKMDLTDEIMAEVTCGIDMIGTLNAFTGILEIFSTNDEKTDENESPYLLRDACNALILYKLNDTYRIGGGVTASSISLSNPTGTSETDVSFDKSFGFLIDGRIYFEKTEYVGVRLIFIDFSRPNDSRTYSGNSIGLTYGFEY